MNKNEDKENDGVQEDEVRKAMSLMLSIVKYLGKAKLEFENAKNSKIEDEMSEYEVHLQKLEAQIREHIRVMKHDLRLSSLLHDSLT